MAKKELKIDLVLDENNKQIIEDLFYYFNDSDISKFDTQKGILIVGGVGCGKTIIIDLYSLYTRHKRLKKAFVTKTSYGIETDYSKNGVEGLEKYVNFYVPLANSDIIMQSISIDDIGTEDGVVKHYGNEKDAVSDVLFRRHEKRFTGGLTHGTSNMTVEGFRDRFEPRLVSRFNEMFNFVVLKGNDRRKQ